MQNILKEAEVINMERIGEGARVCLDFVDRLTPTEGVLIGNTGHGYMVVLAENRTTDTYPARPFRVNCGAIHHYLVKDGQQTNYLAEVKPGDTIHVINHKGETRTIAVGRVKIEKRPFIRIVAKVDETEISATLQDADSVHLLAPDDQEKQVSSLKEGDLIMVRIDQPGRHLGEKIEEEITEL
ncbi:3-dehydroquinate synthase II [Gracilibacillus alcaliphilus]|uniref:3-dehydroquinate synthase II n=1 Tax=Gracilibacillus alcaliphilus TaxID=1401441 RepID=UPI00195679E6|nr:3-dehydroquinate synthase II [Gracilibacillus alcaliphilus]MBM7679157.1 3-dehydroquinate synthase II [Gracilibacillus alcaliphilus]